MALDPWDLWQSLPLSIHGCVGCEELEEVNSNQLWSNGATAHILGIEFNPMNCALVVHLLQISQLINNFVNKIYGVVYSLRWDGNGLITFHIFAHYFDDCHILSFLPRNMNCSTVTKFI